MTHFIIYGKPMAKQRPRMTGRAIYTPEQTVNYENLVKVSYIEQVKSKDRWHEGALEVHIRAYYQIAKSHSNKKKAAMETGEILPTIKPDHDNISKIICDSLNGIAYADDKQITDCIFKKRYAKIPRVEVSIREVQGDGTILEK